MLFNPDPSKPAQDVKNASSSSSSLNNIQVERASYQKQFGIVLDEKRIFKQHIDSAISKINKGMSVFKKLRHSLPQKSLITTYKAYLRPLIDFGNIIYDQPQKESFCEELESIQYKAASAISISCIYQELGLESLTSRRYCKRLSCLFKMMKKEVPHYLINLIPKCEQSIRMRNNHTPTYQCRKDCFKYSLFPSILNSWFNLDDSIRNFESILIFKRGFIKTTDHRPTDPPTTYPPTH